MTYLLLYVTRNIYSIFPRNSETLASKYLENLEEMFLRYYMGVDVAVCSNLQSHTDVLPAMKELSAELLFVRLAPHLDE